jgi:Caspase domain
MSREPKRKALIIAISEYNDKLLDSLEFCKNDGEKMYELLRSLRYEISDNHKLIGYVEFDKIREAIYDFFDNRKTNADDTLLFYYSGHGIPISGGNTCLASSEIDYYSPRKMGFSSHELTTLIQESNSIRIVEVLDCCYSGAARIGKGIGREDAAILGAAAIENNARLLQQGEGKCLLAASQATEEAFGLSESGHSAKVWCDSNIIEFDE